MSKQLEVWYPWNGKGKPPACATMAVMRDGHKLESKAMLVPASSFWERHGDSEDIVAYTTGKVRRSKRATRQANG